MRFLSIAVVASVVLSGTFARASAEPARQQADREARFEPREIDEAIGAAGEAARKWSEALTVVLDGTKGSGAKRTELIVKEMGDLVNALARLRVRFDEDEAWGDQRLEARTAYTKWKELDPILHERWAKEARDEFEVLHRALRDLARIYEVDAPRR